MIVTFPFSLEEPRGIRVEQELSIYDKKHFIFEVAKLAVADEIWKKALRSVPHEINKQWKLLIFPILKFIWQGQSTVLKENWSFPIVLLN